ncbi:MAG TPA: SPOR domain-containing protein [Methylocystis sp.]|nr:SPOR domain-containing protein [Methylocystis sp.]
MRESTTRRAAIDIDDFERRLRAPNTDRPSPSDPLSELARLMQGGEPTEPARRLDRLFAAESQASAPQARAAPGQDHAFPAELRGAFDDGYAAPYSHREAAAEHGAEHAQAAPEDYYSEHGDHYADEAYAEHAQGSAYPAYEDDASYLHYGAEEPPAERPGRFASLRSRFRPWHAVTALSLIGVSAIAYGFAHRAGAIGSREIAVITAPTGPVKVAPPVALAEQTPEGADAAVLDRQEQAQVKGVVSHEEQAMEPTVEPRAAPTSIVGGAAPKRVKTVSVRPDGSLIDNPSLPPAVSKATAPEAAPKRAPETTPKVAIKPPVTTGKPETPLHAAEKAKPLQKLAQKPAPEAVPADEAANDTAAGDATHSNSRGGFAVQFGAAGSEAEARAMMSRIAAKYGSKLGGQRPTFKIAKVGDKTVYRVRVHGISKEAAAKVCNEVKAGGDACFVAGAN